MKETKNQQQTDHSSPGSIQTKTDLSGQTTDHHIKTIFNMEETSDYQIDTNDLLATDDVAGILSQDILDPTKVSKNHDKKDQGLMQHDPMHQNQHPHPHPHQLHPHSEEHYQAVMNGLKDGDMDPNSILTSNISAEVVSAAAAAAAAYGGLLPEADDIVQNQEIAQLTQHHHDDMDDSDDDGHSYLDIGMSHEEHLASRRQKDRERYASMSKDQREVYNCKRREQYHRQSETSRKKRRERERVRYHSLAAPRAKERNLRRASLERERYKKLSANELASRNSKRRSRAASLRAHKKAAVAQAQAHRQAAHAQQATMVEVPMSVVMQPQASLNIDSLNMHTSNGVPMSSIHMDPVAMASMSVDVGDMNHAMDMRGAHIHSSMVGNLVDNMGGDDQHQHFKHEV